MSYSTSRMMSHRGKVAEVYDATYASVMTLERTRRLQATKKSFSFLDLPAEIRNEIYRLLLVTGKVSTFTPTADHTCRTPGEGTGVFNSLQSGEVANGTIRCESWRTYSLGYQVSILRSNRQIYREASGIFHLENFWIIARVNKAGFGKEMKDRGFPVATVGDLWRYIRFPVMKVTIVFPSLESQKQNDILLIATVHLTQLIRVLWTAQGASEMEVTIDVQRSLTNNSPSNRSLLRPFLSLRSIKKSSVLGLPKRRYISDLTHAMTKIDSISRSFSELKASLESLQQYIKARKWRQAVAQAEAHSILMADCSIVYDNHLLTIYQGVNQTTAILRYYAINELIVATATCMAEVTLYLRQYTNTVRFTNQALDQVFRISVFFQSVTVLAPPNNQILSHVGTPAWENETKCSIFLIRARAYMGMRLPKSAFRDIEEAGKIMPDSATVATVFEAWQAIVVGWSRVFDTVLAR